MVDVLMKTEIPETIVQSAKVSQKSYQEDVYHVTTRTAAYSGDCEQ
jgi:hypothetical protein